MIRLAVDIGGTFTDVIAFDEASGRLWAAKASTTPANFTDGVLDAIQVAAVDLPGVVAFVHGTTVVINAITQRRGVKTALVTTAGFRDVLEIGRGNRPDMYNLKYHKPRPFVPRSLRFEVRERVGADGSVRAPLAIEDLEVVAAACQAEGVQAVAICFLHAYAHPEHEQQAADFLSQRLPGVSITASSRITREWREFERSSTVALNAYVQPILDRYLAELERRLDEEGSPAPRFAMLSCPAVAWTFLFFLLPLGVMIWQSLQRDGFSLFYYRKLLSTPLYLSAMVTTFEISLVVTAGCLLLGYPVAYFVATAGPRLRAFVILLVVIPYWLDYIVRSYSWMVLLGRMGLVNRSLMGLGVVSEPLSILYSIWSVDIGMIQILLPLMILTLYGGMHGIDQRLVQAAAIHGARPWEAFRRVFFPLSLPGVYGACLLTFVVSMGFYITPALLGGRKQTMISQLIYTLASDMLDWPLASAVSVLLLAVSLAIVLVYNRLFSIDRLWGGATS